MTSREDLLAKIRNMGEALAVSGQMVPRDLAIDSDLTLPQLRILYMLSSEPARITDISLAFGMARANASTMVDRLVRKGLVERVPYPNDRRVTLACITDEGRAAIDTVNDNENSALERIAEALSMDELEVVACAMEILNQGAKKYLDTANEDSTTDQETDR